MWLLCQFVVQWCTQVAVQPGQGPEQLLIQGIVLCRHWVLDEGRELVEDVIARCVGLPVPGCQAREAIGVNSLRIPVRPSSTLCLKAPFLGTLPGVPQGGPIFALLPTPSDAHSGGPNVSSRNSSICSVSVLTSPSYSRMGSCEPGAKSFSTSNAL